MAEKTESYRVSIAFCLIFFVILAEICHKSVASNDTPVDCFRRVSFVLVHSVSNTIPFEYKFILYWVSYPTAFGGNHLINNRDCENGSTTVLFQCYRINIIFFEHFFHLLRFYKINFRDNKLCKLLFPFSIKEYPSLKGKKWVE